MITFEDIANNAEIRSLIKASGDVLTAMNYTEHGLRHASYVSNVAQRILFNLGYDERLAELARIAGYVHDVGNAVNRLNHGVSGAMLIYPIFREMGMSFEELSTIISAIGNHEEEIGTVIGEVSAAVIIADKSDAHRTRVKRNKFDKYDIHDRVNYAIKKNLVVIDGAERVISSKYYMDDTASVMDYLTIYLPRMVMSERAAKFLNCAFRLYINDVLINSPRQYTAEELKQIIIEEAEDDKKA